MKSMPTNAPSTADWIVCTRCRNLIYRKRFERTLGVCPDCGRHSRLGAQQRVEQLLDTGSWYRFSTPPGRDDPLSFVDCKPYLQRLHEARRDTGLDDAVLCGRGRIEGRELIVAVMDFRFIGGSLGCAVGEGITTAAEHALVEHKPLLMVTASGGARMQEGALALMQMVKTAQALAALDEAGVPTISLITDPTFGGVAASYATLADIIIAEPGARLGFAGPRVIEQTIHDRLPEGFQTAEFLLERGLVDEVVPRSALRSTLARLLAVAGPGCIESAGVPAQNGSGPVLISDPGMLPARQPWEVVQAARITDRPTTLDYAGYLLEWFVELHGDRCAGDSPAVVGGIGLLGEQPVMVIGHQKGHSTHELVGRNFGMPTPAGFRKVVRLLRMAGKLGLPVITLVDTPGAYPGVAAEENGQAVAIAESIRLLSRLPVPVISVVTGEGGSGGALALAVADRVLIVANGYYSVISPEGCAAILWRQPDAAVRAAAALRLDAAELLRLGIVDAVVPEPDAGSADDPAKAAMLLRNAVVVSLQELMPLSGHELVKRRYQRFRQYGSALFEREGAR